jgi:hypothetical protein
MKPVTITKLESSEEYKTFEAFLLNQIMDMRNYHLHVYVKVTYDEGMLFANMTFYPEGAESYQFMDGVLSALVHDDFGVEVTVHNCVSEVQDA